MSRDVSSTIDAIQAAAFSPEDVPKVMQRVARLCGGELAIAFNADPGKPDLLGDERATAMQRDYLAGGWMEIDVATRAVRSLQRGGVRLTQEFVGARTIRAHPFFQEYLVHHGGPWGMGWHVSTSSGKDVVSIAGAQPFQREQAELLQRLAPMIDATLATASSICAARSLGAAQGLEFAGRAAVLLDARGCVAYVSDRAEQFFSSEFRIVGRRLFASDAASLRELDTLSACARNRLATAPSRALVRRTDGPPVVVMGRRLAGAGLDLFSGGRMLLMLAEVRPMARPSDVIVQQLYHLTPTETRVASLFAKGQSPDDIAAVLSLRVSTVRQHIKSVHAKTDTHRQAELALLLAAVPGEG